MTNPARTIATRLARRPRSSDALERQLAQLVVRRQDLRLRGASDAALERNRRKIGRVQRDLALALIARHRPAARRTAV